MKVTVTKLKVSLPTAIHYLRDIDKDRSILNCQKFINDTISQKVHIVEKNSWEHEIFEYLFDFTIEEYSQHEANQIQREKDRILHEQKLEEAWRWIEKNVSDEGKQHIKYIVDNFNTNSRMKYLLLDIDFTTFWGRVPRPYLKEFIERHQHNYYLGFFTGANGERLAEAFRLLYDLKIDYDLISWMRMNSLCSDFCPIIDYQIPNGGVIEIKCFETAAKLLNCQPTNIILLDDMLRHGHPYAAQYIQAPQFMGDMTDTYLKNLKIEI